MDDCLAAVYGFSATNCECLWLIFVESIVLDDSLKKIIKKSDPDFACSFLYFPGTFSGKEEE